MHQPAPTCLPAASFLICGLVSGKNLRCTHVCREVPRAAFATPSAFIFLPFNNTFLTFYKRADAQASKGWRAAAQSGCSMLTNAPWQRDVISWCLCEVGGGGCLAQPTNSLKPFLPLLVPMQLWDFEGNCLATLAGAWLPSSSAASTVYVSNGQELLFVYCPPGSVDSSAGSSLKPHAAGGGAAQAAAAAAAAAAAGPADEARWWEWSDEAAQQHGAQQQQQQQQAAAGELPSGCIKVFDLLSGRQVAVVQPPLPWSGRGKPALRDAVAAAAARAALQHCSTLFYCEASRRIYTGTANGKVQAWAL